MYRNSSCSFIHALTRWYADDSYAFYRWHCRHKIGETSFLLRTWTSTVTKFTYRCSEDSLRFLATGHNTQQRSVVPTSPGHQSPYSIILQTLLPTMVSHYKVRIFMMCVCCEWGHELRISGGAEYAAMWLCHSLAEILWFMHFPGKIVCCLAPKTILHPCVWGKSPWNESSTSYLVLLQPRPSQHVEIHDVLNSLYVLVAPVLIEGRYPFHCQHFYTVFCVMGSSSFQKLRQSA